MSLEKANVSIQKNIHVRVSDAKQRRSQGILFLRLNINRFFSDLHSQKVRKRTKAEMKDWVVNFMKFCRLTCKVAG